jgi:hypothetical protein
MAIELSNLTFTEQDDIVPVFGPEQIVNTGIANTLAGNDKITGISTGPDTRGFGIRGIHNIGTLNTSDGNDIIIGSGWASNYVYGILNEGTINTGDGNDKIRGNNGGLVNYFTITTDNGDDIISGGEGGGGGLLNLGNIYSGEGNDIIIGINSINSNNIGGVYGIFNGFVGAELGSNSSIIDTDDGNDIITGIAKFGIFNYGIINTGNGADSIISDSSSNSGSEEYGFFNANIINTGNGNDLITEVSSRSIFNYGIIDTGNGDDSLIAEGGFYASPFTIPGSVFLGNGKDYLKGFGSGNFNGGNAQDALELTSGSYTVGRSGTAVNFIKDSITMNTSEFEILIAGNTIYNFASLTNGQIITVA